MFDADRKTIYGLQNTIYGLDDQDKAEAFAGQRVRVWELWRSTKSKVENTEGYGWANSRAAKAGARGRWVKRVGGFRRYLHQRVSLSLRQ